MKDNFLYLILLAVVEIAGDFSLEKYANNYDKEYNINFLILGCISYIGVIYFLIKSLEGSTILFVNGMWDGLSGIIESAAAMIFLGERYKNYEQYIGLSLIIIGLFFLKNNSDKGGYIYNFIRNIK
jgi:multidrug transporter EmrE-like cation transporter